ncbi:SMI1/KNR4 family protein [Xylocopilactobacillus apis]|uniref:SMI1/KNR4 family protein n=1 Tax=Xylocopilactobacillus apis TaxID=2932183 RepID=A0AAU9CP49_9LACO|nr:SMI1/KNR4 family protein [Xylocopilactobacillus apis]BDR55724.1 hypothetical protein KIMC2_02860 [Xylocopilactobacillus apis]
MIHEKMMEQIGFIEEELDIAFPGLYRKFLAEEIQDNPSYEIQDENESNIYLFCYTDVLERNETYQIQSVEPQYCLIGQDGDIGYFVYVKKGSEKDAIYSLDFGALGSLSMERIANDIYDLSAKRM